MAPTLGPVEESPATWSRSAVKWVRPLTAGALAIGLVMLTATILMEDERFLSDFAVGAVLLAVAITLVGVLAELIVRFVPRHLIPVVFAVTLVPGLGILGAVGLPEAAIHYSQDAEWAYRAGREVSLAALYFAVAITVAVAWRSRYPLAAVIGLAAVTFALAAVGRDLWVRGDLGPSWCYADQVEVHPDGGVATAGENDGCTVLLPAPDPLGGP